jgi:hypothetical protein
MVGIITSVPAESGEQFKPLSEFEKPISLITNLSKMHFAGFSADLTGLNK